MIIPFFRELLLSLWLPPGPPQEVARRDRAVFSQEEPAALTLSLLAYPIYRNEKGEPDLS